MQKIVTHLWFDNNLEEAIDFYSSIFEDSKIKSINRYTDVGPGEPGSVMFAVFELAGQEFMAVNGGPEFKFNEAVSLYVRCKDQAEVDELWEKLTAGGGEESMCGWLKDKFGLFWQIVPDELGELMNDPDPQKVERVTEAMLKMRKIDIQKLREAGGE